MSGTVLADKGAVWATNNHLLQDPGTGNAFVQNGLADAVAVVGAGTYKLPDYGLPQYVRATGAVTITNAAGTTVATLASGDIAYFLPTSTTAWKCASHSGLLTSALTTQGVVPISLFQLRIVSSGAIGTLLITDATPDTGGAGLIASTTAPTLGPKNGATDARYKLSWAASSAVPVLFQTSLPKDIDSSQPVYLKAWADGGSTDLTTITVGSYWGDAGGVVTDTTTAINDAGTSVISATIAAADYAANYALAPLVTMILTPGTHANDALNVYGIWLEYTRKLLTS